MAGLLTSVTNAARRLRYGDPIVVVSGLPRSGTSMMMRMLDTAGLDLVTDAIRQPDEDNPHSYYEFEPVKRLHEAADKAWLLDCRGRVIKIVSFFLRDLPATHDYRVIFMRRDLREVLASQRVMLERRGEPADVDDAHLERLYRSHLGETERLLSRARHLRAIEIPHRQCLDDPLAQARRVADFLGRSLPVSRMAGAVDPMLHRNRA